MSDMARINKTRSLFAKLTAAYEDAAGIAAHGQGAAELNEARKDHACLIGIRARVAELMERLETELQ